MRALHFGAGNIGKGFIGYLLSKNGYDVCFVDVNQRMIDDINQHNRYEVEILSEELHMETISSVTALNSITQQNEVIGSIVHADIITTSVGVQNLSKVAVILAEGLKKRVKSNPREINIMANENAIHASSTLKTEVYKNLTQGEAEAIDEMTSFPNTAVDRLALSRPGDNGEIPMVEPFYEWVIDQSERIEDHLPLLQGVTYTNDLLPYIERKLCIVNMGHAATAYLGHLAGYQTIRETLEDAEIAFIVKGSMQEAARYIEMKFDANLEELNDFIDKILSRFKNPRVNDDVKRVGRSPIRKLGNNERMLKPALTLFNAGVPVNYLSEAIAAGFLFDNPEDEESEKLQEFISAKGINKAVEEISGIKNTELIEEISNKYNALKKKRLSV
ncbi:mannitol-1-phosphate 5-dehydrogenase [Jeotgalibacillus sp. R-1-5s-1]|uniref:mannitol-1-phosphate 5-dehydrogenase n=1 Tax=Jeotgalibacillus sp. R-1-5s-1 TaxID=2555897 RepID=UPI00141B321A|nr:mannitol-1-phosphate 5-dehydrogenase [Jeotgalibacillus sp. R-1-5s-1]